ncbi:MAG: hypothetical protein ACJAZO_000510 [Myxococcota bacterium]|jgi:hypothetical protein
MKHYLPFILPFSAVLLGAGLVFAIQGWLFSRTPPEEVPWVPFAELDASRGYVRTSGMGHYGVVMEQTAPGNLVRKEEHYWLYPLSEPYDTEQGPVRVMVRSEVPPEDLVTYELMTVEGWISRSTPDSVPYEVEIAMGRRSNYYFGDQMLFLDAVVVESGLDPRVEATEE